MEPETGSTRDTCHKSALKAVCSWILSLPNVQNLKLRSIDEFGKPWELEFDSLEKLQALSSLYLLGRVKSSVTLKGLFPMSIRKLTLSMCQLAGDPMAVLGQLAHLRILRLLAQSFRGSKMTCVHGGFNQLQVLKLWMLSDLVSWTIKEGAMPNVHKMEIRMCDRLQNIDGLNHLGSLKDLILTNMSKMITDKVKWSIERGVHVKENTWQFSHYQVINFGDGDRGSPEGDVADYVRPEILEDEDEEEEEEGDNDAGGEDDEHEGSDEEYEEDDCGEDADSVINDGKDGGGLGQ